MGRAGALRRKERVRPAEPAGWADGRCGPEHAGRAGVESCRHLLPQSPPGLPRCCAQDGACPGNRPGGGESGVETGQTSCAPEDLSPAQRCGGPEGTFQPVVERMGGGGEQRSGRERASGQHPPGWRKLCTQTERGPNLEGAIHLATLKGVRPTANELRRGQGPGRGTRREPVLSPRPREACGKL